MLVTCNFETSQVATFETIPDARFLRLLHLHLVCVIDERDLGSQIVFRVIAFDSSTGDGTLCCLVMTVTGEPPGTWCQYWSQDVLRSPQLTLWGKPTGDEQWNRPDPLQHVWHAPAPLAVDSKGGSHDTSSDKEACTSALVACVWPNSTHRRPSKC